MVLVNRNLGAKTFRAVVAAIVVVVAVHFDLVSHLLLVILSVLLSHHCKLVDYFHYLNYLHPKHRYQLDLVAKSLKFFIFKKRKKLISKYFQYLEGIRRCL
jgi:hypothetical protein